MRWRTWKVPTVPYGERFISLKTGEELCAVRWSNFMFVVETKEGILGDFKTLKEAKECAEYYCSRVESLKEANTMLAENKIPDAHWHMGKDDVFLTLKNKNGEELCTILREADGYTMISCGVRIATKKEVGEIISYATRFFDNLKKDGEMREVPKSVIESESAKKLNKAYNTYDTWKYLLKDIDARLSENAKVEILALAGGYMLELPRIEGLGREILLSVRNLVCDKMQDCIKDWRVAMFECSMGEIEFPEPPGGLKCEEKECK